MTGIEPRVAAGKKVRYLTLSWLLTLSQSILLAFFLLILLLAFHQLSSYRQTLTTLTTGSLPAVIHSGHIYAQVHELTALAESLSLADNALIRRLTYQQIVDKIRLLQQNDVAPHGTYQQAQLSMLAQELSDLNTLTQQRLTLLEKLAKIGNSLNGLHAAVLSPIRSHTTQAYTAWALQFSEITVLASQVAVSRRLQDVRRASAQLQQLFIDEQALLNTLPADISQQAQQASTQLFALLLEEDGLLATKSEQLRVSSRSNGRANFVRNLVQHYARITEYDTDELNNLVLQQAGDTTAQITRRMYVLGVISVLMLVLVLAIIWFVQRRVSGRLSQLNENVLAQLHGDALKYVIRGNDEIADISQSFQYFADKVAQQTQALQQLSFTDSLTGLANRRALDQRLQQEINSARRQQRDLALLMLDIDYFKAFNDFYGHQAGDDGLKQVSAVIQNCIKRQQDIVARYGGEEFVCILPDTDANGALEAAEAILAALKQAAIPHQRSDIASYVTVSIGIMAGVPDMAVDGQQWLASADEALYQAKTNGRNQVVLFGR